MARDTGKMDDLKIAFAGIIATFAKNSPDQSPIPLVGGGVMSGILLCLADRALMKRIIEATLNESQLTANKASAQGIIEMFHALEELHDKGLAGHEAGKKARARMLGVKPPK